MAKTNSNKNLTEILFVPVSLIVMTLVLGIAGYSFLNNAFPSQVRVKSFRYYEKGEIKPYYCFDGNGKDVKQPYCGYCPGELKDRYCYVEESQASKYEEDKSGSPALNGSNK